MSIEEELFKKTIVNLDKLLEYGFKKENEIYKYSINIMDETFKVTVEITSDGIVNGKIYDLSFQDEYTNFRLENNTSSFISEVRDNFIKILIKIRDKCFSEKNFIFEQSNRLAQLITKKYGDYPNFEWKRFPGYATFKNKNSQKWYAIIMNIDKNKLDGDSSGEIEIINLKLKPQKIEQLLKSKNFYPAYHMNKKSWITIVLDNTVKDEEIIELLEESHTYTDANIDNSYHEWLIPANPKYFDVDRELSIKNTIMWKQNINVKVDDIIYLYITNPISSIMYKLKVVEINIPYNYKDKNMKIQKVMKIALIRRYEKGKFSIDKLRELGVSSVRSARHIPLELSEYIKKSQ